MKTELIEKLKKVSTGLGRLGQIAEQNSINEAIALLEKPRVSAEEVEQKLQEYIDSRPYYGSCTTEYKEGIEDGAKWMHDYAWQSDAKQMKKHAIEFKTYIDDVEQFSLRTLSDEERYNEYQAFLNREEKQK